MSRLKGYLIPERLIVEIVAEANELQQAKVNRVWYDPCRMSFVVVFESDEFEEVPECSMIPVVL